MPSACQLRALRCLGSTRDALRSSSQRNGSRRAGERARRAPTASAEACAPPARARQPPHGKLLCSRTQGEALSRFLAAAAASPEGPLHFAAGAGHIPAASHLLDAGVPASRPDSRGRTSLSIAAARGDVAMARLLLDSAAGAAAATAADADGATAAHFALAPELLGAPDIDCATAAPPPGDHMGVLRLLLERLGAQPSGAGAAAADRATLDRRLTPLMLAAAAGNAEAARLLVETGHARLEAQDAEGRTALAAAALGGHTTVMQVGCGGLCAARHVVPVPLAPTCAMISMHLPESCCCLPAKQTKPRPPPNPHPKPTHRPQVLLDAKASVDRADGSGSTPLMLAVQARRLAAAELLLARGAHLDGVPPALVQALAVALWRAKQEAEAAAAAADAQLRRQEEERQRAGAAADKAAAAAQQGLQAAQKAAEAARHEAEAARRECAALQWRLEEQQGQAAALVSDLQHQQGALQAAAADSEARCRAAEAEQRRLAGEHGQQAAALAQRAEAAEARVEELAAALRGMLAAASNQEQLLAAALQQRCCFCPLFGPKQGPRRKPPKPRRGSAAVAPAPPSPPAAPAGAALPVHGGSQSASESASGGGSRAPLALDAIAEEQEEAAQQAANGAPDATPPHPEQGEPAASKQPPASAPSLADSPAAASKLAQAAAAASDSGLPESALAAADTASSSDEEGTFDAAAGPWAGLGRGASPLVIPAFRPDRPAA